jgi:hypothetical protein
VSSVLNYNSECESWESMASQRKAAYFGFYCTSVACCSRTIVSPRINKKGEKVSYSYVAVAPKVLKFNAASTAVDNVCPDCKHTLMSKGIYK